MNRENEQREKVTKRSASLADKGLTTTEMEVLRLILDGKSNKQAAYILHRSVRTVEDHRSHIMRKLGADNLVDLVKKAAAIGLVNLPTHQ